MESNINLEFTHNSWATSPWALVNSTRLSGIMVLVFFTSSWPNSYCSTQKRWVQTPFNPLALESLSLGSWILALALWLLVMALGSNSSPLALVWALGSDSSSWLWLWLSDSSALASFCLLLVYISLWVFHLNSKWLPWLCFSSALPLCLLHCLFCLTFLLWLGFQQ